jgi:hypothetical protein
MYTSFLSLSLLLAPLANSTPAWQPSYAVAMDVGQKHGKPVAVFVGSGPKGISGLVKEGELPEEAHRLLAERYVCVYVDETNGGKKLARDLGITQGKGMVISDRSGTYQAYHHDGQLSQGVLASRLRQYADPGLVVTRTESNGPAARPARVSYYSEPARTFSPSYFAPPVRVQNC